MAPVVELNLINIPRHKNGLSHLLRPLSGIYFLIMLSQREILHFATYPFNSAFPPIASFAGLIVVIFYIPLEYDNT